MNAKVSAYAHVYGPHFYAATFVPIVMETLVHDKPKRRRTFAENFSKGYILGTDFENYQLWIMWMEDTWATRILAPVFHKHKYITNHGVTPEDRVTSAEGKLADGLKGRMTHHLSETTLDQLELIVTILKKG